MYTLQITKTPLILITMFFAKARIAQLTCSFQIQFTQKYMLTFVFCLITLKADITSNRTNIREGDTQISRHTWMCHSKRSLFQKKSLNMGPILFKKNPLKWVPFSAKMTLKNGYGFRGLSSIPPSKKQIRVPPTGLTSTATGIYSCLIPWFPWYSHAINQ